LSTTILTGSTGIVLKELRFALVAFTTFEVDEVLSRSRVFKPRVLPTSRQDRIKVVFILNQV
jgi:hypothetical protein